MSQSTTACLPVADAALNDDVRAYLRRNAAVHAISASLPVSIIRAGYHVGCVWLGDAKVSMARVFDTVIDSDVSLRFYIPTPPLLGVIMYMHGGGFTIGSVETHDALCRTLASSARCAVASVEYRRAPEHRHPTQLNDCMTAYTWLAAHAGAAVGDVAWAHRDAPRTLVLAGDSAGGYLTLMLALGIRDYNRAWGPDAALPAPALLAPIYPLTDNTASLPSRLRYGQGYLLTRDMVRVFHRAFLASRGDDLAYLRETSPLHASDLSGLPRTIIMTAEYDVLHDEGVAMVTALSKAGVPVQHVEAKGCIHGFVTTTREMPSGVAPLQTFVRLITEALSGVAGK